MTALHQFGAEMLKLSRGLESVVGPAAGQQATAQAPAQQAAAASVASTVVVVVQAPPVKPTIATIDHQLAAIRFVVVFC